MQAHTTTVNGQARVIQPNAQPGDIRYVDANGDGRGDTTRSYPCVPGGSATETVNPVLGGGGAAALPVDATVVGLDVVLGGAGAANLDDFAVAGVTVADFRTFTAAGPLG